MSKTIDDMTTTSSRWKDQQQSAPALVAQAWDKARR